MDLQKIVAQANAAAAQRSEGAKEGASMFTSQFADMVRLPVIMAGSILGGKDGQKAETDPISDAPTSKEKTDRSQSSDRQVDARSDGRDENTRTDRRTDDRAGPDDVAARPEDNGNSTENGSETNDVDGDETPRSANNDDGGSDEDAATSSSSDDAENAADTDQAAAGTDEVEQHSDGTANTESTFDTALDGLIAAAHTTPTDGAPKEAAQAIRNVATETKVAATANTGAAANTDAPTSDGEQSKQAQQAQSAQERVGTQTANNTNAAAKTTTELPLVDQQAKALADTLKSDKPVKIQVTVDNRAGTSVSQTTQSLNANGLAAQETGAATAARANGARASSNDSAQQIIQPRVDGTAQPQGQVQAQNQLAQANVATASDPGLNRAASQVSTVAVQSSHGGGEAVNATTPGGASATQQIASDLKAQQSQAARSPEQTRPLHHQISVNITKALNQGLDRISIQLRPDNLGRVEIKLEVAHNGRVSATIIADRPEALDLLRNDARNLERALQDAGLDTRGGDLSFNLRDQQENPGESQSGNRMVNNDDGSEDGSLEAEMANRLLNGDVGDIISETRVDIRA